MKVIYVVDAAVTPAIIFLLLLLVRFDMMPC